MKINLNDEIKNVKGTSIPLVEEKTVKEGKALTIEAKNQLQDFLNTQTDETIKKELLLFAVEYINKTEFVTRTIQVRDVLQTVVGSLVKPSPKDMVKMTKLLPKLDDDCLELELSPKEVEWLVQKLSETDEAQTGSIIKARLFALLDPEGEILGGLEENDD